MFKVNKLKALGHASSDYFSIFDTHGSGVCQAVNTEVLNIQDELAIRLWEVGHSSVCRVYFYHRSTFIATYGSATSDRANKRVARCAVAANYVPTWGKVHAAYTTVNPLLTQTPRGMLQPMGF